MSTIIHLVRHGEVYNPDAILYGRLPGFGLSEAGHAMADRLRDFFTGKLHAPAADVRKIVVSPLLRTHETAAPTATALNLQPSVDPRVIEAGNQFEGLKVSFSSGALRDPRHWWKMRNPLQPSWGEPYREQVKRMKAAILDLREEVQGSEAMIVSHQLPIWITRRAIEKRPLWHDPRKRECALASITSLYFDGAKLTKLLYQEPAADLITAKNQVSGA